MGKAMVNWGLTQPNAEMVVATCNPDNIASIRGFEKIGFPIKIKSEDKIYWS
jgi:[ribosomal protein S5]-alanine N-acetyltransferase